MFASPGIRSRHFLGSRDFKPERRADLQEVRVPVTGKTPDLLARAPIEVFDHPNRKTPEKMSQPTSIQMLDAAIWKELGAQEGAESEAFYHALGTLLSRWLLARSDYPEMEAIKLFAKVRSYVARPERFL